MNSNIKLDVLQQEAVDLLVNGAGGVLRGYAGTGKSTVIAAALEQLAPSSVLLMAPTNKACMVMKQKSGRLATTIHKATLTPTEELVRDDKGQVIGKKLVFVPASDAALAMVERVIIDEASMIGMRDWMKALSVIYGALGKDVAITMVGDGFQLPPINDVAAFDEHVGKELELTRVYRQEGGSAILDYATDLRSLSMDEVKGLQFAQRKRRPGGAFPKADLTSKAWLAATFHGAAVALVYTNMHRMGLNRSIREALFGDEFVSLQVGERVISYAGYKGKLGPPVTNGASGIVMEASVDSPVFPGAWATMIQMEDASCPQMHHIFPEMFFKPTQRDDWHKAYFYPGAYVKVGSPIAPGYALTAHKAQGSSWPIVALEDRAIGGEDPEEIARWMYTGVTRAEEELYAL